MFSSKPFLSASLPLAVLLFPLSAPVVAESETPVSKATTANQADQVVVTATRMAQTTDQTLVPVSVITREQIEQSPATSLPELLRQVPGVDMSISGGNGKSSSLYMRGTGSGHTLVLIDGVKIGSSTLGSTPFQDLPLDQIERIEVVRGPRSSLYGSEAIGGVIQIFTRKPKQGLSGYAKAGTGTHNTKEASGGISAGSDLGGVAINLSHLKTDGIDAKDGGSDDDDGYENNSASINMNVNLGDSSSAVFTALHSDSRNEYDRSAGDFNDYADNMQQTLGLRLNSDLSEDWTLSAGVNQHRDESEAFDNYPGQFMTKRQGADVKSDHYLAETQILTIGLDYQRDMVGGSSAYLSDERENVGGFGQWQAEYGDFSVLAGLRHDDSDAVGSHNTGNINLGYQLDSRRRVLASYGTAFKAPTFNDLYWPAGPGSAGNPDLESESSESFELGYEVNTKSYHYAARAFVTKIDDLIDWACTSNCDDGDWMTDFWQPSNVNRAKIKGLELESGYVRGPWSATANASLLDPRDQDSDKYLVNRARRTLQLDLTRSFETVVLSANLLAQGERFTNESNTTSLPGYGVVNLKASYDFAPNWAVEAKVNNLFDKEYATQETSFSLDRVYLVSVRYNR
ncbi:MAG: TonB-dependent receptor [Motiliproteus sp.]